MAISGFSLGAKIIITNNGNTKSDEKSKYKSYSLNSHVILREKNHKDLKEKLNKKIKVPRDIREDFLIYESQDAEGKVTRYKLPLRMHKIREAFALLCKSSEEYSK